MKLLTNFENAHWNPPQSSILCDWSKFANVDPSLVAGKYAKFTCHRRLSIWYKRITGGFLFAGSKPPLWRFWRGLLWAFSKLVNKAFQRDERSEQNFDFDFFNKAPKSAHIQEKSIYYDKRSKKIFISWPNPFKAREKTYDNSVKKIKIK